MAVLGELGIVGLLFFVVMEITANCVGLYAASVSLPGFKFKNKQVILIAGLIYTVLHIVGGFLLAGVLNLGIFSGSGLLVGYLVDVAMLYATDKILKDFEITTKEALFTGAFLLIFCWGVGWFLLLIIFGAADLVDLRPILGF